MTWFSGLFLMTDPGYPHKTGRREEVMEYEIFTEGQKARNHTRIKRTSENDLNK